jgi:hypothetical protein
MEDATMMRRTSLCAALLATATAAAASDEIPVGPSVYFGVTTNSIFRGVSQTTDQNFYHRGGIDSMTGHGRTTVSTTGVDDQVFAPAVYGGFNYLYSSGLYAGVEATSVDIPGFDAFARVDGSAGYRHNFDSGWRLNVGAIAYAYPGESGSNFWEVYAGTGYGPASVQVWHDPANHNTYYQGQLHYDIGSGVQFYLTAGHYSLDLGPDYNDFGARLSKSFGGLTVGGGVADTTLDSPIPYLWLQYRLPL